MNKERIDQFIEQKGVNRTLTHDDRMELIRIVCEQCGDEVFYRYCLYPHQTVPTKEVFRGLPGRTLEHLEYLNILELVIIDSTDREPVISFLDSKKCPWELVNQFDPDSGTDEPIGIRIKGFTTKA